MECDKNTLQRNSRKGQSALEYLTTYAWAILILTVILAALFYMHLFSPSSFVSQECVLPVDFTCISFTMLPNGVMTLNLQQTTAYPINITAIGCTTSQEFSNMVPQSPQTEIQIAGNATFANIQCLNSQGVPALVGNGNIYEGYLEINYTDLNTGFPHSTAGRLIVKAA